MPWRSPTPSTPAYDLAYFVGACLEVDAARERELYDRWIDGLVAAGVPDSDLADMWDKYRTASLFCLVYPAVAAVEWTSTCRVSANSRT